MKFPKLPGKFILAPMAGVTDIAFRELCVSHEAAMTFTEFVSSDALSRKIEHAKLKVKRSPKEKVFGVQVFGSKPQSVKQAALAVQRKCDVIDFNIGCSAWSIQSQGCGSSLLENVSEIEAILKEVISCLKKPLTIKIRSGIGNKPNFLEIGKMAKSLGVAAITLHPRSAKQRFSGKANWEHIKQLKEIVKIPVIGNGDVFTPEDAVRMLKETGCDYVMIGRAARSNPLIFEQANELLTMGKYKPTTAGDKSWLIKDYLELARKYYIPFERIKLHVIQMLSGFRGAKNLRCNTIQNDSIEELASSISLCFKGR